MTNSNTGMNPNINYNNYSRDVTLNVSTTAASDSVANILMNVTYSVFEPYEGIIEAKNLSNDLIKISLSKNDFSLLEASLDQKNDENFAVKSLFEKFAS